MVQLINLNQHNCGLIYILNC
uniref:Uncharacterized protein n=1 Tax=Tetranychus urticae TaxID=32264 RepID=T1KHK9_TETUR